MSDHSVFLDTPEATLAELDRATTDFYTAFPDVIACARKEAARMLKARTGKDLDPDAVYWHRFANAASNHQSFTGWEHYGPPAKSLTMTELTLRRFDISDQINAIDLDSMSGFYTADATATFFDQHNELAVLPLTIMNDLWEANFAGVYQAQLNAFWSAQAEQGRVVAKALCVSNAFQAMRNKMLSRNEFKQFINSVAGPTAMPPTMTQLRRTSRTRTHAEVYDLTLGDIRATDIIRVCNAQGHHILHLPPDWFQTFESEQDLYDWICTEATDPARRQKLLSHFGDFHEPDSTTLASLNATLDTMVSTPWAAGQTLLNAHSTLITKDVFSYLMDNLQRRLESEAKTLLTSNWDLQKTLFLVELSAFARVTAGLAPGDSVIAGIVVGTSAFSLGAHVALALHGKTHEERSRAAILAVIDGISLLFSLPMLKGTGRNLIDDFTDLAEDSTPFIETNAPLEFAVEAELTDLPTERSADGGVFYLVGEKRYIRMNHRTFEVQFIDVLDRWVVINPQTPGNLVGAWPVEPNWRGMWEPYVQEIFDPEALAADAGLESSRVSPQLAEAHRLSTELQAYEPPIKYVEVVETLIGRDSARLMTTPVDAIFSAARDELLTARNELASHARAFFSLERPARTVTLPATTPATTPRQLFEAAYANGRGLVIGEATDGIGSKKLLIKYMGKLKELGVQTLYTDWLVKDLHQGWIDHYLRLGHMPTDLYKYLRRLTEQSLLAKYTPLELIRTARLQGVKIKALDCTAAHQVHGLSPADASIGQQMRNYYALQRIRAHQAARPESNWVALVHHTRMSTFEDVPGLADLTDTLGIRIKDVSSNTAMAIAPDTGQRLLARQGSVRGDLQIEVGLPQERSPLPSTSV